MIDNLTSLSAAGLPTSGINLSFYIGVQKNQPPGKVHSNEPGLSNSFLLTTVIPVFLFLRKIHYTVFLYLQIEKVNNNTA